MLMRNIWEYSYVSMHTYVTDGNRWYDGTLGNVFSDDADEDAADYYDDVLASAQFPEILPVATKRVTKKKSLDGRTQQ